DVQRRHRQEGQARALPTARMTEQDMIRWFNAAPMGSRQQQMLWAAHKIARLTGDLRRRVGRRPPAVMTKRGSSLWSTTQVSRPVANAPVSMLIRFDSTSGRSLGVCP